MVTLPVQEGDDHFASQTKVYDDIGKEMLEHAFEGSARFLASLFV